MSPDESPSSDEDERRRDSALRTLDVEFGELFVQIRQVTKDTAERLQPGLLPGGYIAFTAIVRRGPITLSRLADELAVDKALASRTVRQLEDHGLVRRTEDPNDRRLVLLAPTPEGVERLAAARSGIRHELRASLDTWSVHDIERLAGLLHALQSGEPPTHPGMP